MTAGPSVSIVTGTATVCVFDPALLRDKLEEDCDWWSLPSAELAAVNAGQVAFFNVGGDGAYELALHAELAEPHVEVHLAVVSGRVFIGAGEDVTGGGLEPDTAYGVCSWTCLWAATACRRAATGRTSAWHSCPMPAAAMRLATSCVFDRA